MEVHGVTIGSRVINLGMGGGEYEVSGIQYSNESNANQTPRLTARKIRIDGQPSRNEVTLYGNWTLKNAA